MVHWKEPTTLTDRVSVYIQLLAGSSNDDFELELSEDGMSLHLTLYWLRPMTDPAMMLRKWLRESTSNTDKAGEIHAELQAFAENLRQYRSNRNERICSITAIPLPIRVQQEFVSQSWLQWSETAFQGILVRLKGRDVSYGIAKHELTLETV